MECKETKMITHALLVPSGPVSSSRCSLPYRLNTCHQLQRDLLGTHTWHLFKNFIYLLSKYNIQSTNFKSGTEQTDFFCWSVGYIILIDNSPGIKLYLQYFKQFNSKIKSTVTIISQSCRIGTYNSFREKSRSPVTCLGVHSGEWHPNCMCAQPPSCVITLLPHQQFYTINNFTVNVSSLPAFFWLFLYNFCKESQDYR